MPHATKVEMLSNAALIVGINTFLGFPPLQRAESDAKAIYNLLLEQGWNKADVTLCLGQEATLVSVRRHLRRLKSARFTDDSFLLFYYAGHGYLDDDIQGWLACYDTSEQDEATGLAMRSVMEQFVLGNQQAKRALAILDCCAAGAIFAEQSRGGTESPQDQMESLIGGDSIAALRTLKTIKDMQVRGVLAACRMQERSYEGEGRFTARLIEGWRGGEDGRARTAYDEVTITSLKDYLDHEIKDPRQHPGLYVSPYGSFVLSYPSRAASGGPHASVTPARPRPVHDDHLRKLGFSSWRAQDTEGVPGAAQASDGEYLLGPFIAIGGGFFEMGSSAEEVAGFGPHILCANEYSPQTGDQRHRVNIPPFEIARFPVSIAEYALFVRQHPEHTPYNWERQHELADYPVTGVSWYDAKAYCDWLSQVSGTQYRLPTEAEWEKAARWDPNAHASRLYSWGDEWDPSRCKASMIGVVALGGYHAFASAYGVEDMTGNIGEWTCSTLTPYPFDPTRTDPEDAKKYVVRGCSSQVTDLRIRARAAFRREAASNDQLGDVGFRLVRLPEPSVLTRDR